MFSDIILISLSVYLAFLLKLEGNIPFCRDQVTEDYYDFQNCKK